MKRIFSLAIIISAAVFVKITIAQSAVPQILWERNADVNTMKFTTDGNVLFTGGKSNLCYPYSCGQLKSWRIPDSTLLSTIENYNIGLINDIEFSSGGSSFITGNGSVYCSAFHGCLSDRAGQYKYDLSGAQINSVADPGGIVYSVAYSPDESIIAAGTGYNNTGEIRIYDSNFNLLRVLSGHNQKTQSLLFTPDGQNLISGGYDGYIKFWDYNTGTFIRLLQHGNYLNGGNDVKIAISPDGQFLASTGQGYNMSVKLWRIADGDLIHTINIDNDYGSYSEVAFSPNGLYFVSGLQLYASGPLGWHGKISFYDVITGELVREYIDTLGSPASGGVRAIAFSPLSNNIFAYGVGYGNYGRLRVAVTDLNLVNDPTPVELSSFTSSVFENRIVLSWSTSSELNNKEFEIERSEYSDISWNKIGSARGNGTSTKINNYSFEDKDLLPGKYLYRLKQIDFDGSYSYSHNIETEVTSVGKFNLSQNYPNPFNPSTTIEYYIPADGFISIIIYNAIGEQISVPVNEYKSAGRYLLNYSNAELPGGMYFYTLNANGFSETRKMILLK